MCSNHTHENHASAPLTLHAASLYSTPPLHLAAALRQQPGLPSPPQVLLSPHSHGFVYNISLHHLTVIFQSQVYFPNLTPQAARYTQCRWTFQLLPGRWFCYREGIPSQALFLTLTVMHYLLHLLELEHSSKATFFSCLRTLLYGVAVIS